MVQTQRPTGLWTIDIESSLRGVQNPLPVLQLHIYQLAAKMEILRFFFYWLKSSKKLICVQDYSRPLKSYVPGDSFLVVNALPGRNVGCSHQGNGPGMLVASKLRSQLVSRWPLPVPGDGGPCAKQQHRQSQLTAFRLIFYRKAVTERQQENLPQAQLRDSGRDFKENRWGTCFSYSKTL